MPDLGRDDRVLQQPLPRRLFVSCAPFPAFLSPSLTPPSPSLSICASVATESVHEIRMSDVILPVVNLDIFLSASPDSEEVAKECKKVRTSAETCVSLTYDVSSNVRPLMH